MKNTILMWRSVDLLAGLLVAVSWCFGVWGFGLSAVAESVEINRLEGVLSDVNQMVANQADLTVDIEVFLEPIEGQISFEQTFMGDADETLIVYIEGGDGFPDYVMGRHGNLVIFDPDGEFVFWKRNYPTGIDLSQKGHYVTVQLPKTGEYQVRFGTAPLEGQIEGQSLSAQSEVTSGRLLKIRSASDYERWLITAHELMLEGCCYDESLALIALAIEQNPDLPASYILRLLTYYTQLLNSPEANDAFMRLDAAAEAFQPADMFELMHGLFSSADADVQALMMADLRRVSDAYRFGSAHQLGAIDAGSMRAEASDEMISPADLADTVAHFLETGEQSEILMRVLFGMRESSFTVR